MSQIHPGLKRVFTIFNIFFAIIGGLIIGLALIAQIVTNVEGQSMEDRTVGLIALYVFGAITMVVAGLGAYGACKEKKAALIAFLVCMVIGSLVMLRVAIPTAIARPELEDLLESKFQRFVPLTEAPEEVKNMANTLQSQMHCCGLFSYEDWRQDIPESCECDPAQSESESECRKVDYSALMLSKTIYSRPCFPILMKYILMVADITLGVVLTLAVFALLGLTLSSIMIHQMRYPDRPPVLLTVPAVFGMPPPKYQELHNTPPY
ncbi:tetraspanin-33-like [Salarias fasciatus]|uniref:Tetraspanin n=1 Tax=Salarias fasciatus TaxID=181472 RepID=A0A672JR92_SALFA|nr:tetraspanin-33-like [Salarias fasciatus]